MITNIYFLCAGVEGVIGLHRSPCTSSRGLEARYVLTLENLCSVYFPRRQETQVYFSIIV